MFEFSQDAIVADHKEGSQTAYMWGSKLVKCKEVTTTGRSSTLFLLVDKARRALVADDECLSAFSSDMVVSILSNVAIGFK
jgi:hypothetical protein